MRNVWRRSRLSVGSISILLLAGQPAAIRAADHLQEIKARGVLQWGADAEGGAPYVFPDPDCPHTNVCRAKPPLSSITGTPGAIRYSPTGSSTRSARERVSKASADPLLTPQRFVWRGSGPRMNYLIGKPRITCSRTPMRQTA